MYSHILLLLLLAMPFQAASDTATKVDAQVNVLLARVAKDPKYKDAYAHIQKLKSQLHEHDVRSKEHLSQKNISLQLAQESNALEAKLASDSAYKEELSDLNAAKKK